MGRVLKFLLNPFNQSKYSSGGSSTPAAVPTAPTPTDQGVRDAAASAQTSLTSAFSDTQLSDPNKLNKNRTALGAWL